jgi:hypothetical protein
MILLAGAVALGLSACQGANAGVASAGPPPEDLTTAITAPAQPAAPAVTAPAPTGIIATVDRVTDKVVLEGTRSLLLAHNAYQGAEAVLTPLVNAGTIPRSQLERIRTINNLIIGLLEAGNAGQSAGVRAAQIFNLVGELNLIAGRKP